MLTPKQNSWFLTNIWSYLLGMTLVQEVDIIKAVGLLCLATSTALVPCFGHKAAAAGNKLGYLVEVWCRGMKEKTHAYPFLEAPVSQHQEQKGICHTDWRLQGRHHTAPFTNATELPASKSAKGNTQGFGQEFGALCFTATAPSPLSPAKIPARTVACCCHLCSQSQQALPSHPLRQAGLSHSLPLSTARQSTETRSSCAFGSMSFFSSLCLCGRCRPFCSPPI